MQDAERFKEFGRLLQEFRLRTGLTQEVLAERAGLGRRSIQSLEGGESRPHRETLQRLMRALALTETEQSRIEELAQPSPRRPRGSPETIVPLKWSTIARSAAHGRDHLPAQLTSFIGREPETAEVKRLLQSARLVTLTGPGGCGKTRLAYHVASEVQASYADGVVAIELAAVADPSLIAEIIAVAVNLHDYARRPPLVNLAAWLRRQHLLLLLDNCEHLLDACARIADTLLCECPRLTILLTSREPLRIVGEAAWRVLGLPIPPDPDAETRRRGDAERDSVPLPVSPCLRVSASGEEVVEAVQGYAAVRLFEERARAVRPAFAVTRENAPAVARICRRLDGLPHAIELAAARVNALSVDQIAERLDDRFRLLTTGSRTAAPRHQTLRATIDWSHDLLSEPERILLRRLAVFAGGWTLDAAEVVCPISAGEDVLDRLGQLVDKSLVQVDERAGVVRYRLLETIREYAWERLIEAGEEDLLWGRHWDWCLTLAEEAELQLWGARQREVVETIRVEHDNLWAALAWSVENDSDGAARLASSLFWFWAFQSRCFEMGRWFEALLMHPPTDERARAKVLLCKGFSLRAVDPEQSVTVTQESVDLFRSHGDWRRCGWALNNLGEIAARQGHPEEARVLHEESLACFRKAEDEPGIGMAVRDIGEAAGLAGDDDRAESCLSDSLMILRQAGDCWNLAYTLLSYGEFTLRRADYGRARSLLEEARAQFDGIKSVSVDKALVALGCLALLEGDTGRARRNILEALPISQKCGFARGVAAAVYLLGVANVRDGAVERGVRGMGAAAKHVRLSDAFTNYPAAGTIVEASLTRARTALGEEGYARAWAEGQAITLEQAVAYALSDDAK